MDSNLLATPSSAKRARRRNRPDDLADARPRIVVGPETHKTTAAAIEALAEAPDLYVRHGRLVRVLGEPDPEDGQAIVPYTVATMVDALSGVATFWRGTNIPQQPPRELAQRVCEAGVWPGLRKLVGIEEAPLLLPSGEILQVPGYHAPSKLIYAPTAEFAPVLDKPTKDDAVNAASEIHQIVEDFPFESDAHHSAWLALVLTAFTRRAHDGCVPMGLFNATTPGSGKTKLADTIALLKTGRRIPRTPYPWSDEELTKKLTSVLLGGSSLLLFDNVRTKIGGPAIEALITSRTWADRLLGGNSQPTIANDTLFMASGNNISVAGDMSRRVLVVSLTPKTEKPEERDDFKNSPLEPFVLKNRARFVRAALTVLRAFNEAGRPSQKLPRMGGFEEWSLLCRDSLVWLGWPDPLDGRAKAQEDSDGGFQNLRDFVAGFAELLDAENKRENGMTVHEMLTVLRRDSERASRAIEGDEKYQRLRTVLEIVAPGRGREAYEARRVGAWLGDNKERYVGREKIARVKDSKLGICWTVRG